MPKFSFLVAACLGLSALHAFADDGQILEEVTIIGDRDGVRTLLGSGALVDSEQVANEVLVDINQALKTVPGIYIQEEDGYGLRPNIGIRGATSGTVFEDQPSRRWRYDRACSVFQSVGLLFSHCSAHACI